MAVRTQLGSLVCVMPCMLQALLATSWQWLRLSPSAVGDARPTCGTAWSPLLRLVHLTRTSMFSSVSKAQQCFVRIASYCAQRQGRTRAHFRCRKSTILPARFECHSRRVECLLARTRARFPTFRLPCAHAGSPALSVPLHMCRGANAFGVLRFVLPPRARRKSRGLHAAALHTAVGSRLPDGARASSTFQRTFHVRHRRTHGDVARSGAGCAQLAARQGLVGPSARHLADQKRAARGGIPARRRRARRCALRRGRATARCCTLHALVAATVRSSCRACKRDVSATAPGHRVCLALSRPESHQVRSSGCCLLRRLCAPHDVHKAS